MSLRKACQSELKRLPGNLANGPESDADRKLYLDTFERHARSPEHAKRVIDSLIETCLFYPKIAEIVKCCGELVGNEPRVETVEARRKWWASLPKSERAWMADHSPWQFADLVKWERENA